MLKSITIKHNILAQALEVGWHFSFFHFKTSLFILSHRVADPRIGSMTYILYRGRGFYIRALNQNRFCIIKKKRTKSFMGHIKCIGSKKGYKTSYV